MPEKTKTIRFESEAIEVPDWVADAIIEESLKKDVVNYLSTYARKGNLTYDVKVPYVVREL